MTLSCLKSSAKGSLLPVSLTSCAAWLQPPPSSGMCSGGPSMVAVQGRAPCGALAMGLLRSGASLLPLPLSLALPSPFCCSTLSPGTLRLCGWCDPVDREILPCSGTGTARAKGTSDSGLCWLPISCSQEKKAQGAARFSFRHFPWVVRAGGSELLQPRRSKELPVPGGGMVAAWGRQHTGPALEDVVHRALCHGGGRQRWAGGWGEGFGTASQQYQRAECLLHRQVGLGRVAGGAPSCWELPWPGDGGERGRDRWAAGLASAQWRLAAILGPPASWRWAAASGWGGQLRGGRAGLFSRARSFSSNVFEEDAVKCISCAGVLHAKLFTSSLFLPFWCLFSKRACWPLVECAFAP